MRSVLGLELSHAVRLLEDTGYTVRALEVRSRKGQPGNERRVIRERERGGEVELVYAVFRTVVDQDD